MERLRSARKLKKILKYYGVRVYTTGRNDEPLLRMANEEGSLINTGAPGQGWAYHMSAKIYEDYRLIVSPDNLRNLLRALAYRHMWRNQSGFPEAELRKKEMATRYEPEDS